MLGKNFPQANKYEFKANIPNFSPFSNIFCVIGITLLDVISMARMHEMNNGYKMKIVKFIFRVYYLSLLIRETTQYFIPISI